jgi:2-dehydropantoate 2-reductase
MTERPITKVCIYGAGAVGGWIGALLAAAGCQVSVVTRGATLQALQKHGLRLQTSDPADPLRVRTQTHAVAASAEPASFGVQDLVVIAVKAPALLDVARHLKPLLGPGTMVLPAMNGVPWWFFQDFGGAFKGTRLQAVDPTGEIATKIPPASVIGSVVHASCAQVEPGVVRHHFGNRLIIGEPSGQKTARVRQLAELLERAGFDAPVSEQIQKDTWYKLWGNMTVNPVSAITGATTDLILGDKLVRQFMSSVMLEAKEIGARIGIPILQNPEDRHNVTLKLGAFKTSMLQDVEAGRSVELDALVTVVKELGALTGVATPNIDALLGLSRLHAKVRGLY